MNEFKARPHKIGERCGNGFFCKYCKAYPTSSAGTRRLAKDKVRTRRKDRHVLNHWFRASVLDVD